MSLVPGPPANVEETKNESEGLSLGLLLEFSLALMCRRTQVLAVGDCPLFASKPVEFVPQTQGPWSLRRRSLLM